MNTFPSFNWRYVSVLLLIITGATLGIAAINQYELKRASEYGTSNLTVSLTPKTAEVTESITVINDGNSTIVTQQCQVFINQRCLEKVLETMRDLKATNINLEIQKLEKVKRNQGRGVKTTYKQGFILIFVAGSGAKFNIPVAYTGEKEDMLRAVSKSKETLTLRFPQAKIIEH